MFKWVEGRQGSGYFKCKLIEFSWPFGFDVYLLKFNDGVSVPEHVDPCIGKRHFRLNIVTKKPISGGEMICEKTIFSFGRICLFRPDLNKHSLTTVGGRA